MLVPSGSNKNHYPAEVNISTAPLQLGNSPLLHPASSSEDSNLWNIVSTITENSGVGAPLQGILTTGVVSSTTTTTTTNGALIGENNRPGVTDSVNNNKRNNLLQQSDNFRQNYNSFTPTVTATPIPSVGSDAPLVVARNVVAEEEEEEESNRDKEEEDADGGDADDDDDEVVGESGNRGGSVILSEVDLVASVNISLNNSLKNHGVGGKEGSPSNTPLSPPSPPVDRMDSGDVGIAPAVPTQAMQNINNKKMVGSEEMSVEGCGSEGRKGLTSVREEMKLGEEKRGRGSPKMSAKSKALHKIMSASMRSMSTSGDEVHGEKMDMTTSMTGSSYGMNSMKNNVNNNHVNLRQGPLSAPNTPETMRKHQIILRRDLPLLSHSMYVPHTSSATRREKYEFNQIMGRVNETNNRPLSYHGRSTETINASPSILSTSSVNKRHVGSSSSATRSRKEAILFNRRSMPSPYLENRYREKFDVSALDTNLPRIDLEALENHLRIAREEERKRRSDREEIRRRLALESDDVGDKPNGRKPSLHSRLQSSMNLQICFMNETASDSESPNSDTEAKNQQPASLPHVKTQSGNSHDSSSNASGAPSEDFYAKQARLQAEARQALSQAKDMARLQMSQEKDRRLTSPITEMVKNSLLKVGVSLPPERRRVSRQLLTEMNVAQLQVIVNDLHTHIEVLNETLVSMLLERDDLHMEQDSMLVDVEDLTRYLAAKDNSPHQSLPLIAPSRSLLGKK